MPARYCLSLQKYFSMYHFSQIVDSILSFILISFLPSLSQPPFLKYVLRQKKYPIFIISIIASTLIANIVDDLFINRYEHYKYLGIVMLNISYILLV